MEWFKTAVLNRKLALLVTYGYPILILLNQFFLYKLHGFKYMDFVNLLCGLSVWGFNVCYLYPKYGISRSFKSCGKQLDKAREELFLAKLKGESKKQDSEHGL